MNWKTKQRFFSIGSIIRVVTPAAGAHRKNPYNIMRYATEIQWTGQFG
jgi:hypothetical protein